MNSGEKRPTARISCQEMPVGSAAFSIKCARKLTKLDMWTGKQSKRFGGIWLSLVLSASTQTGWNQLDGESNLIPLCSSANTAKIERDTFLNVKASLHGSTRPTSPH
jgi:hypothetical protein